MKLRHAAVVPLEGLERRPVLGPSRPERIVALQELEHAQQLIVAEPLREGLSRLAEVVHDRESFRVAADERAHRMQRDAIASGDVQRQPATQYLAMRDPQGLHVHQLIGLLRFRLATVAMRTVRAALARQPPRAPWRTRARSLPQRSTPALVLCVGRHAARQQGRADGAVAAHRCGHQRRGSFALRPIDRHDRLQATTAAAIVKHCCLLL